MYTRPRPDPPKEDKPWDKLSSEEEAFQVLTDWVAEHVPPAFDYYPKWELIHRYHMGFGEDRLCLSLTASKEYGEGDTMEADFWEWLPDKDLAGEVAKTLIVQADAFFMIFEVGAEVREDL